MASYRMPDLAFQVGTADSSPLLIARPFISLSDFDCLGISLILAFEDTREKQAVMQVLDMYKACNYTY